MSRGTGATEAKQSIGNLCGSWHVSSFDRFRHVSALAPPPVSTFDPRPRQPVCSAIMHGCINHKDHSKKRQD
jgi:hypothetical protein